MLPIFTSVDDVKSLTSYLKNKPTGATPAETKAAIGSNPLDPRKLTAYTIWRFLEKTGDRLKLLDRGWRLARKPAEEVVIWREVIDSLVPYRSVLEWAFHQKMLEISNVDVAVHWHEHHSEQVGTENENTLKDAGVCFFNVCQGAQLGKLVIGRRGQATRLQINMNDLKGFIEAGPTLLPGTELPPDGVVQLQQSFESPEALEAKADPSSLPLHNAKSTAPRIFIAHGKNMKLVEQVQTMLGLAAFESEVAEDTESTAIPVPEKVFSAMRRCDAGIIIVSSEDSASGGSAVNQNVLIEIGAAFVLYDRKVVLVWDKQLAIPSNLQGLYRCEFEGEEFTWSAGMKLMKAIKGFS